IVCLKTGNGGQGIKRVGLGQPDNIVWKRVDPEHALVEVLHHKRVAQLCDVDDSGDVFGKLGSIFQAQTISVSWNVVPLKRGRVNIRVLIIKIISLQFDVTGLVLPVIGIRFETDCDAAAAAIVESDPTFDIIRDWERDLSQERRAPGAEVGRRNGKTESAVERLIHVRPPKDRNFSDVEGDVLKNDVVDFINSHRSRWQMKIRARRIVRGECTIFDAIHVRRSFGHVLAAEEVRMKISARIARADLCSLNVINSSLGHINAYSAVNSDVAFYR